MAERYEVEAWVNPAAWATEEEAQQIIEQIMDSGSDSEAEWTRIALGDATAILEAAARDYDRAAQTLDAAKTALREALIESAKAGMSEVELARKAGLTRVTVRRWIGKD